MLVIREEISGRKAEPPSLVVPFEGYNPNALEALCGELDRLAAGENGVDDIRRKERELHYASNVARMNVVSLRDLVDGSDFSRNVLMAPQMCPGDKENQVGVEQASIAVCCSDDQLRLNAAALQQYGNRELKYAFWQVQALRISPVNHVV